ncbi:MAG: hypothetical protein L0215_24835 [Gemmataceae bacterium]|nr:hypothetical protein [Gemmataceae bacterium]
MAEPAQLLLVDSLTRAARQPCGLPLFAGRSSDGLFASNAAAKKAARFCQDQGLLQRIGERPKGKTTQEIWALSDKGFAWLMEQTNPKPVLEALVAAVHTSQERVEALLAAVHENKVQLLTLRGQTEKALQVLRADGPHATPAPHFTWGRHASLPGKQEGVRLQSTIAESCATAILSQLDKWQDTGMLEDCPLPELFRTARPSGAELSIGRFHDALRRLHEERQLYLHPWTGPLYELPEPALALLVGHEVAYYASLRSEKN